jgi:uncharacterized membrane protein YdjX (TVP38/TMEM64 family)
LHSKQLIQYIPLFFLLAVALIFYGFDLVKPFHLSQIKEEKEIILSWLRLHPLSAIFALLTAYILSICLILPTSTLLSVLIGILYPLPYALIFAASSETIGAFFFFLIVRLAAKQSFFKEKLSRHTVIYKTFQKNPVSYLLSSRFSHLIPYWLINTSAALFKTPIWTFLWTTFIGVLPFCYLATETGSLLKTAHTLHYKLMTTPVKILFLFLALAALTPVFLSKFFHKKKNPF